MQYPKFRRIGFHWLLLMALLLIGCGGGGGGGSTGNDSGLPPAGGAPPAVGGTSTFSGGTLDDLKAMSPTLQFDHLVIGGPLKLPIGSAPTISANSLTITSLGSVGYSFSSCQYQAAPNITLSVANDVVIEGSISLSGRSGTSITESAACNRCTGQRGGDVTITGGTIKVLGRIFNRGGAGASVRFSFGGSSQCSAGSSGSLTLAAKTTLDLSEADIDNRTGTNFDDQAAASGAADISAGSALTMVGGGVQSTGAMTLKAATTDIFAPITFGSLTETIGGKPDTTAPAIKVLSPLPGAVLTPGQMIDVQVQASDDGTGLKNVRIQGLGYDKTHPPSDFSNRMLTVPLQVADVPAPATLQVTGTDNKGNAKTVAVTGLQVQPTVEAEPDDSIAQAQMLDPGGAIVAHVRNGDPGFVFDVVPDNFFPNEAKQAKVEDFYKVICCDVVMNSSGAITDRKISALIDFSAAAAGKPDIDVYLFDATGTVVVASSVRDNVGLNSYTETISRHGFVPSDMGRAFYIGVQAFNVPTATEYKIKR